MSSVIALARVGVAEALRDRILYGLVLFGIALVLLSTVLSNLTLGFRLRVVTDLSLSTVNFAGIVIAILLGVGAVSKEIDRRLVFPLLAKPVERSTYVIGRFFGVLLTTWLNATLMVGAATVAIALYSAMEEGGRLFTWADFTLTWLLLLVRIGVVAAIAVALSSVVSATVALIGTTGITLAGYLSSDLRFFLGQSESAPVRTLGDALYYILPDMSLLDPLGRLVYGQPILTEAVVLGTVYALAYASAVLIIASILFTKRDLG